jgi:hypothetical protein
MLEIFCGEPHLEAKPLLNLKTMKSFLLSGKIYVFNQDDDRPEIEDLESKLEDENIPGEKLLLHFTG